MILWVFGVLPCRGRVVGHNRHSTIIQHDYYFVVTCLKSLPNGAAIWSVPYHLTEKTVVIEFRLYIH